ncbi:hypothetical protein AFLA70_449g000751 [Aspergillus flavus AF70]|nr:hypothetical protein AFLA70_449g000751 [Aspergillus flavus AF70]
MIIPQPLSMVDKWAQGKSKAAEEMYQRALAGKEKAFGPDHSETGTAVNNQF